MIITRTPFRISLFGGGSDFPSWYRENEGAVVSFSIDKYCYITTRILPPFFPHKYRIAYSLIENVSDFQLIQHPVVREAIRHYFPTLGLEIHHDGDLPARSGMGSSSAFAAGLIHSLLKLRGQTKIDKEFLAQSTIFLEQEILNENVGSQDQIACTFGGLNFISFGNFSKSWKVEQIVIRPKVKLHLEQCLVLVYSGVNRYSSDISLGLTSNISSKAKSISKSVEMAKWCRDIFSTSNDISVIGEMLDESWENKRAMNSLAITPELDFIYSHAKKCGATGGKVLGAGGGGFLIFWVPQENREKFKKNFKLGTEVPFQIESEGSTCILG